MASTAENLEDMAKRGFRSVRRRTALVALLGVAVVVLMTFRTRRLGSSEHEGAFINEESPSEGRLVVDRTGATSSSIMKDRIARLQEACWTQRTMSDDDGHDHDGSGDPALNPPRELIVEEKNRLIYCNVPKVGCTNWKSLFLKLSGIDDIKIKAIKRLPTNTRGRIYLNYLHKYEDVSKRRDMLRNYTKFLFVRHPFSRVLSAFRDKLAPNISYMFRSDKVQDVNWIDRYGLYIIRKYRGDEEAARIKPKWKTEYDLKFAEFVRYLIDTDVDDFDKHWKPISSLCRPCDVRYDVIGRYETLNVDADYILRLANVDPEVKYPPPLLKTRTNSSSLDILKSYYKNIPRAHIRKLYDVYRQDFELFDYSLASFYRLLW